MMGRGKRSCIRGITSTWPAAASFQAAEVFILPPSCQPSLNCASVQHHLMGKLQGEEGHWQDNEVVPAVTTADVLLAPSTRLRIHIRWHRVHSTQNCLLSHPLFLRAQQGSLRGFLPEAGVF